MSVSLRLANQPWSAAAPRWNLTLRQLLFLLVFSISAALVYAYCEMRAIQVGYQLTQSLQMQGELLETQRRLRVELNNLRTPERLEAQGARLGLVLPKPGQIRPLP